MKKRWTIFLLILLWIWPIQIEAATLPAEIEEALPQEAQELLKELDTETPDHRALEEGGSLLWEKACSSLGEIIRERLSSVVLLLCVVLLCAVADDCFQAVGNSEVRNIVPVAGILAITLIAAGNLKSLLGIGVTTIEQLEIFSKALLPTLAAAVAASGGIVSAGTKQVATVIFAELVISLIRNLLLPLLYFYIGTAAAAAMLPEQRLERIAAGICKGITWILTGSLVLFTGYLTISGAVTGSADELTIQLTRSAIGTAVPVVGNIINDATLSVLSGASILKNSIGVVGMLSILAVCLLPFLHLGIQYLLYKLAAFLAGSIGTDTLMKLIDALGTAFGLILGMTGTSALLLLISIASSVSVNVG